MKIEDFEVQLGKTIPHVETIIDGERFWVAFVNEAGTYTAAWINEDGELRTATRKSAAGAVRLAMKSWGC